MQRRRFDIFSMSFLDTICCAFGAIVLLYMILNASSGRATEHRMNARQSLRALGVHPYRRGKYLALFAWAPPALPDPKDLVCTSHFALNGTLLPEFDRFGLFSWEEALGRVGKSMALVLSSIPHGASK